MKKILFGKLDTGAPVHLYKLKNEKIQAEIITFGAAIHSFGFAAENEKNLVGSYDTIEDYLADDSHQGAIIGRVANRIADGSLVIDGTTYHLPKNDGNNCLHGGCGFDRKIWDVAEYTDEYITLSYYSADGEEGFPGGLRVYVTYSLIDTALLIEYTACPEAKTAISLTNHAYFNLNGMGSDIYSHKAQIFANSYSALNAYMIPTGEHPGVEGTVFDLRIPKPIGDAISESFIGYDHNFVLSPTVFSKFKDKELGLAATVTATDKKLSVYTDMKDIQFYIGNFLSGKPDFAGGVERRIHGAFCLEAQTEPNSVNRGIGIYDKGEIYTQSTAYKIEKI